MILGGGKMSKHIVKFKLDGKHRQRTIEANDIYDAERQVRKMMNVPERSRRLFVKTIKVGRREYQVFGSTLWSEEWEI